MSGYITYRFPSLDHLAAFDDSEACYFSHVHTPDIDPKGQNFWRISVKCYGATPQEALNKAVEGFLRAQGDTP